MRDGELCRTIPGIRGPSRASGLRTAGSWEIGECATRSWGASAGRKALDGRPHPHDRGKSELEISSKLSQIAVDRLAGGDETLDRFDGLAEHGLLLGV